ncbi:hypothetical protein E6O75_ATG09764 [Venturia nashicola]|uniref:Uncharacterized protein n=1 Tax=Venturia nashicola TaxID=86259 RepID=A0A4Z1P7D6_9PEZI|nr:hypothetical protein E6O75_ATG09764 [Venturia nashicola]
MPLRKSPPSNLKRSQSIREDTGRRTTLSSMATMPAVRPEFGSSTTLDDQPASPAFYMHGSHQSKGFTFIEEPEQQVGSLNPLQGLCRGDSGVYSPPGPNPRCRSVYDIVHYDFDHDTTLYNHFQVQCHEIDHPTPPLSIHESKALAYDGPDWQPQIYDDEGPFMKLKRRVSIAGNRIGDNIRRRGGSLKRRMSNRLGLQQFPDEVVYVANPHPTPRFEDGESIDDGDRHDTGMIVFNRVRYES